MYLLLDLVLGGELFCLLHTEDGDTGLMEPDAAFYAANVFLSLEHVHKVYYKYKLCKYSKLEQIIF